MYDASFSSLPLEEVCEVFPRPLLPLALQDQRYATLHTISTFLSVTVWVHEAAGNRVSRCPKSTY